MEPAAQLYPTAVHQTFGSGEDDWPLTQGAARQAADLTLAIPQSTAAFGTRIVEYNLVFLLFEAAMDNNSNVDRKQDNHATNEDRRKRAAPGQPLIIFSDLCSLRVVRVQQQTVGALVIYDCPFAKRLPAIRTNSVNNYRRVRFRGCALGKKRQTKPGYEKNTCHSQADFGEPTNLWDFHER
jgi:hypothetical protein